MTKVHIDSNFLGLEATARCKECRGFEAVRVYDAAKLGRAHAEATGHKVMLLQEVHRTSTIYRSRANGGGDSR